MAKLNRPNGKLFGSSAANIGVFGSGQSGETPTTSTNPDAINTLGTHWEEGWNGAVVSQAPYTAPFVEDMNAVNYVNSYNGAYLLQAGIPEYSRTADYYVDSICTYNGAIYICILDNPAVNASTDPNDPPGTLINFDPTDTTHWDERVELPTMNDNEVLVGSVGGTGVATDTLNQGDIVASSGGLNIKSDVIVNADVKSDAAIAESKLALDHSTDSLNTAISGKAISNLADTTITTPIGDGDVLLYDDNSSKWVNSDSLANHLNDTNNPHQTSMSNLDDANVNDRQTLADGDVMVYDLANTDWVNSPSLNNHLTNTNNPHTTTLANLDDTAITTPQDGETVLYDSNSSKWINSTVPGGALSSLTDVNLGTLADKELLQYDYANSKWINSSDVWSRIQINEPYSLWSSASNLTLTKNSPRYRLFTTTSGITVTLPSTGVSAGTTFKFVWTDAGASTLFATPFTFNASNGSTKVRAHNGLAIYEFVALVNTPTTSNDWTFISHARTSGRAGGNDSWSRDLAANILKNTSSGTLVTLSAGVWRLTCIFAYMGGSRTDSYSSSWRTSLRYSGTNNPIQTSSGDYLGVAFGTQIPYVKGENYTLGNVSVWSGSLGSVCKTGICTLTNKRSIIAYDSAYSTVAATGAYISARVDAQFIAPYVSALAT